MGMRRSGRGREDCGEYQGLHGRVRAADPHDLAVNRNQLYGTRSGSASAGGGE
jgi:hypothetical protein